MIPGDFLYTNHICRIALLLSGNFHSEDSIEGDYVALNLMDKEIYFRRDGNNFILVNQYGERRISKRTKALMKILIAKALVDSGEDLNDIKINGENVEITLEDLSVISDLTELIKIIIRDLPATGNINCPISCPLKDYCPEDTEPLTTYDVPRYSSGWIIYSAMLRMIVEGNILKASSTILERVLNDGKRWRNRLENTKEILIHELGNSKANTVLWIADEVARGEKVSMPDFDLESFNGYLKEVGEYIIPTDKFWNLLYGVNKEKKIVELYKKF